MGADGDSSPELKYLAALMVFSSGYSPSRTLTLLENLNTVSGKPHLVTLHHINIYTKFLLLKTITMSSNTSGRPTASRARKNSVPSAGECKEFVRTKLLRKESSQSLAHINDSEPISDDTEGPFLRPGLFFKPDEEMTNFYDSDSASDRTIKAVPASNEAINTVSTPEEATIAAASESFRPPTPINSMLIVDKQVLKSEELAVLSHVYMTVSEQVPVMKAFIDHFSYPNFVQAASIVLSKLYRQEEVNIIAVRHHYRIEVVDIAAWCSFSVVRPQSLQGQSFKSQQSKVLDFNLATVLQLQATNAQPTNTQPTPTEEVHEDVPSRTCWQKPGKPVPSDRQSIKDLIKDFRVRTQMLQKKAFTEQQYIWVHCIATKVEVDTDWVLLHKLVVGLEEQSCKEKLPIYVHTTVEMVHVILRDQYGFKEAACLVNVESNPQAFWRLMVWRPYTDTPQYLLLDEHGTSSVSAA